MGVAESVLRILFPIGIIALGVGLFVLARWARTRNARMTHSPSRHFTSKAAKLFARPYPIKSSADLYLGDLPRGWAVAGRIRVIVALVMSVSLVLIALFTIVRAR
jgi:hypothetical protein